MSLRPVTKRSRSFYFVFLCHDGILLEENCLSRLKALVCPNYPGLEEFLRENTHQNLHSLPSELFQKYVACVRSICIRNI